MSKKKNIVIFLSGLLIGFLFLISIFIVCRLFYLDHTKKVKIKVNYEKVNNRINSISSEHCKKNIIKK